MDKLIIKVYQENIDDTIEYLPILKTKLDEILKEAKNIGFEASIENIKFFIAWRSNPITKKQLEEKLKNELVAKNKVNKIGDLKISSDQLANLIDVPDVSNLLELIEQFVTGNIEEINEFDISTFFNIENGIIELKSDVKDIISNRFSVTAKDEDEFKRFKPIQDFAAACEEFCNIKNINKRNFIDGLTSYRVEYLDLEHGTIVPSIKLYKGGRF